MKSFLELFEYKHIINLSTLRGRTAGLLL